MKHWSDDDRTEYENAVHEAWACGNSTPERTGIYLNILRDAAQAHREWAQEVLDRCLFDGVRRDLNTAHGAELQLTVAFANSQHQVPGTGGAQRRVNGKLVWDRLAFEDMSREQLLAKQRECDATQFAARRTKSMIAQLLDLIDRVPGANTATEAAKALGLDIDSYLAEEAS